MLKRLCGLLIGVVATVCGAQECASECCPVERDQVRLYGDNYSTLMALKTGCGSQQDGRGEWSNYNCNRIQGVWMPEDPAIMMPFMADPREIAFSIGWRFNDQALTKNIIDVSYADTFGIYKWVNCGPWNGVLQIDVEGALWAVFDPLTESAPLINADYYVGIPVTYAINRTAFRARIYHISSHIGDEFLLNHPHFKRKNPSAEYLDFFVSHLPTDDLRIYGGIGWIAEQDESFKTGRVYAEAGLELRATGFGFVDCWEQMYGVPVYGMHFRCRSDYKNHLDQTYVLGYEFGKLVGLQRKLRVFLEYHDGYSAEGQFSIHAGNYTSIRLTYSY